MYRDCREYNNEFQMKQSGKSIIQAVILYEINTK